MQITVRRYAGLRAWMKYMGVKMPSRPASAMATAQRFKAKSTISAGTGLGNRVSGKKKGPHRNPMHKGFRWGNGMLPVGDA